MFHLMSARAGVYFCVYTPAYKQRFSLCRPETETVLLSWGAGGGTLLDFPMLVSLFGRRQGGMTTLCSRYLTPTTNTTPDEQLKNLDHVWLFSRQKSCFIVDSDIQRITVLAKTNRIQQTTVAQLDKRCFERSTSPFHRVTCHQFLTLYLSSLMSDGDSEHLATITSFSSKKGLLPIRLSQDLPDRKIIRG